MNGRNAQPDDIGRIYRRRKRLVLFTSIPFFALAAVALLARITSGRFLGIPFSTAGPVAYVTFLATLVGHVLIRRCPVCERYLGVVGASTFCPKCGTRLVGPAPLRGEDRGGKRPVDPGLGFKIWTAVLSVFVAAMLFPAIVGRQGVKTSLLITFLAVCAIWGMYYAISGLINWAVAEELKRRERKRKGGSAEPSGRDGR
jgi:hypothetical protein